MLFVVACVTKAYEITVHKSKFGKVCIVLDMVNLGRLGPFAVPLAILALVFVTPQDVSAFLSPCF